MSREIISSIHLLTSDPANTSRASRHLKMALAMSWSVAMASIPSREVRKESARNMEASKPFCTHTNFTNWLAEGEPASQQKRCTAECTMLLACGCIPSLFVVVMYPNRPLLATRLQQLGSRARGLVTDQELVGSAEEPSPASLFLRDGRFALSVLFLLFYEV
ncbi:hypothetical protein [Reticulibacter mediterranei]|uniref:hypothetical protein n=1 Tax=Reticulibacter mediterranei TaxID=2778369 RepID=UPI001C687B32|nr:hypothetical protein [Reticulibacter mediterranei]